MLFAVSPHVAFIADVVMLTAAAVSAGVLLVKAVRRNSTPRWSADACNVLARARQWFTHSSRDEMPNELSREIEVQMVARQLHILQQILPGLQWGSCISIVLHVTHLREASLPQYFLVLMVNVATLLVDWFPWLVTENNMHLWLSSFLVFWPLYIIPAWCSYETMRETWVSNQMMTMFLSLARLRMPTFAFWSVVRTLCVYWAIAANRPGSSAEGIPLLRYELISLAGNILFMKVFTVRMEEDRRRDVEGQATEEKQAAMDTLLEMAYDARVELDQDLCIAKAEPTLSSFLLRQSPMELLHVPFEDLLFEDADRTLFRTRFCAALGEVSAKEVFHLRMRDGNGTAVSVEIFHFHSLRLGRHPRFVLGVREYGDRRAQAAQGEEPVGEADQICKLEEVVAVVDVVQRQLPILESSPAFNDKISPMIRGSYFSPAVLESARFVAWLDASANRQYEDEYIEDIESRGGPPEFFKVEFKPRSKSSRTYKQAFCSATLIKEALSSDDPRVAGQVRMQLTFSQLVEMPLRLRRDSSERSSSSSSGSSHNRSPSRHGSQGRGTPGETPQCSFRDLPAHGPQGPLPEAGGCPAVRVVGASISGRPWSL